jgi:hypothetical protein
MIYTSLAVLALSANAAVSPQIARLVHMHPHASQPDTRISLTIHNQASIFQDVKVDGRSYTIPSERGLTIKAPIGTVVYADSATGRHHRGDVLAEMSSSLDHKVINLK